MKYRCPHCKEIVERDSDKAWYRSWCSKTERMARLQRVATTHTAQRKRTSLLESVLNCLIGIGIALLAQVIMFPWFGIHISFGTSTVIAIIFTAISIVRSYLLRRLFEWLRVSGVLR